jgi:hypothetical protein
MGNVAAIFERMDLVGQAAPILALARVPGIEPQRCSILFSSREGACVCSSILLPDWFILRAIDSRIERMCRVLWREDDLVGVEYVNARTMGREQKSAAPREEAQPAFTNVVALFPT